MDNLKFYENWELPEHIQTVSWKNLIDEYTHLAKFIDCVNFITENDQPFEVTKSVKNFVTSIYKACDTPIHIFTCLASMTMTLMICQKGFVISLYSSNGAYPIKLTLYKQEVTADKDSVIISQIEHSFNITIESMYNIKPSHMMIYTDFLYNLCNKKETL